MYVVLCAVAFINTTGASLGCNQESLAIFCPELSPRSVPDGSAPFSKVACARRQLLRTVAKQKNHGGKYSQRAHIIGVRFEAQERVVSAKHMTTRLFFANVNESGTIGSGSASSAQNCPPSGCNFGGCRANTSFVPSERRGPHVSLGTRSSRRGTPEEREVKSDSSEVPGTL